MEVRWKFDPERIKTAREVNDVSQSELAKRIGSKSQAQIADWEKGTITPGVESLVKIANALQCPPRYFFVPCDDENHQKIAA